MPELPTAFTERGVKSARHKTKSTRMGNLRNDNDFIIIIQYNNYNFSDVRGPITL